MPSAKRVPTRRQVEGSTEFKRAEGIWYDDGVVYVATTADHRVHIPMRGRAESLNLATAAAVCLYASVRAHQSAG